MECPRCGLFNPPNVTACAKCSTPLPVEDSAVTSPSPSALTPEEEDQALTAGVTSGGSLQSAAGVRKTRISERALRVGSALGDRYEVLQQLGEGGMGAVYKVRDRELGRFVALKVIRPELAQNLDVLNRFKQELILARQVTHRNVIRIYDLAEADGVKFITMEFVEGKNLASLLGEKGKFAPKEAAGVIQQVCRALEAAHAEGVIHRDLKPQNIMVDTHGKVIVMDFGIARSIEMASMTQTGALVGTPAYMSPEQAMGEKLDARSDLFSLGIIIYELLTGHSPYKADTTMASLYQRTKERVRPPIELVPEIPKPLSDIAVRCLEIDRAKRYAGAEEILQDLELWLEPHPGTRIVAGGKKPLLGTIGWAAVGVLVVLVVGVFFMRDTLFVSRPVAHKEVSLLVADFANQTADSVFDETLEPAFIIGLEGAPFIETFSRSAARKLATQLRPGTTILDEPTARLVATREGINVIVVGSISKEGNQYAIQVKTVDGVTGKTIDGKTTKAGKRDVLSAVGRLAADVRSVLGDTTPESLKLSAQETFTADSLEAAHEYAEGQTLLWDGKWEESLRHFERASKLDPNMGRAYAGYAVASLNLGRHTDALKYFQDAMAHIDRMTDREKYRTRASYYIMRGEPRKAIEEYTALLKLYPYDDAAHTNLAISYFYLREMDKAVEVERRDVEINPRGLMQRTNLSLYEAYDGDFANAVKEAQEVLKQNPKSVSALGALALGLLGQGKVTEATAAYEQMRPISARGASSSATGLADIALYESRMKDAMDILDKGIEEDRANKAAEAEAIKLNYLAYSYLVAGENKRAVALAEKALALSREPSILYGAGHIESEAGQIPKAVGLASELASQLSPDSQAYGKLILGEANLKNGDTSGALGKFQEAQKMADSWLVHYDLGRAYIVTGAFTEASSELDICLKRRGEATAVFLDDVPSYHYYPPLLCYKGLALEGLKSPGAADSFNQFLAIKAKGAGDPMIADARRRLGLK